MIVVRLFLHDRKVRKATGARITSGGLYRAINTMLIESCAIYAITFLLFMGPWAAASSVSNVFFSALTGTQVCADFTIFQRAAATDHHFLIIMSRSLLPSFSFFEWPTGLH